VIAFDIVENPALAKQMAVFYKSKDELLREADFVTLHLPLTEETRGFISETELAKMNKTAFLVNTSRGGIVDEKALLSEDEFNDIAREVLGS